MTTKIYAILILFISLSSQLKLYGIEGKDSCYSAQLISSKNRITYSANFPPGSKIMHINGIYTVRNGCYKKIKDLKRDFTQLTKGFPKASIVSTYRFRFNSDNLPITNSAKKEIEPQDSLSKYAWERVTIADAEKLIQLHPKKTTIQLNSTSPKIKNNPIRHLEYKEREFDEYSIYIYPFASTYYGQTPLGNPQLKTDTQKLEIGLQYRHYFKRFWNVYADIRLIPYRSKKAQYTKTGITFDAKELYCISDGLYSNRFNLLVGRKLLKDSRSWYYNASLDTIGIFNKHDLLNYEIYGGTRFDNSVIIDGTSSNKHNLKDIKFFIAHIRYNYSLKNSIEFFSIYENSSTTEDRELGWIGLRTKGSFQNDSNYWMDISKVSGESRAGTITDSLNGIGFDLGLEYNFNNSKDSVTLSYAYGSKRYTQPYLTNNRSDYLAKHLLFRYYGSFLKPELTNINITSLYYSHKFSTSIQTTAILALHNYRQVKTSSRYYSASSYTTTPNGVDKEIGNEMDIIFGQNSLRRYNWRFVFAYFLGGDAFNGVTSKKDGLYGQFNFRYYW